MTPAYCTVPLNLGIHPEIFKFNVLFYHYHIFTPALRENALGCAFTHKITNNYIQLCIANMFDQQNAQYVSLYTVCALYHET